MHIIYMCVYVFMCVCVCFSWVFFYGFVLFCFLLFCFSYLRYLKHFALYTFKDLWEKALLAW